MILLRIFLFSIHAAVTWAILPDEYLSFLAQEKQEVQWVQIEASKYPDGELPTTLPPPGTNGTELFNASFLVPTFTWHGDEMPDHRRRSFISAYGTVAKVIFRTVPYTPSYFTGLFRSGGVGLMRIALNNARFKTSTADIAITVATKVYIDGNHFKLLFFSIFITIYNFIRSIDVAILQKRPCNYVSNKRQ